MPRPILILPVAAVNNPGGVLQDLGDLVRVQVAFEQALAILVELLPADHPNIRIARGNLESLE